MGRTKFTVVSRKRPCPICGRTSGFCKHTEIDTPKGLQVGVSCSSKSEYAPSGWKFNGFSSCGDWALFVESGPDGDRVYAPPQARKEDEPTYPPLAPKVLDRWFRAIVSAGSLDPEDRANLHARGFTDEQIAAIGFTTVRPYSDLGAGELPDGFPGRSRCRRGIGFSAGEGVETVGILGPIRNTDGLIVGAQIRLRYVSPNSKDRYRWISSSSQSGKVDGEWPVAVIHGVEGDRLPVAIVEGTGAKPNWLAVHRGYNTIGGDGGKWSGSKKCLRLALDHLGARDRGIRIFPDAEARFNEQVRGKYDRLIRTLQGMGYKGIEIADWGQWDTKSAGDIDEIPADQVIRFASIQEWLGGEIVADSSAIVKEVSQDDLPQIQPAPEQTRYTKKQVAINAILGHRLRFNTYSQNIELDGKPIQDIELAYTWLNVKHGISVTKNEAIDALVAIAKSNQFNPVTSELDALAEKHGNDTNILDNLATRYFGADHPLYQIYIRKWLISAVARAYEPGCKVDTSLILQGGQGVGKSSFFRIIAGKYFDDSLGNASDKDERMKLSSSWILEWAELETVFRKKDVAATKAFLTSQVDKIRVPYGRSIQDFPRPSVICGTTNSAEFLSDETGSRRFWVVPVGDSPIDIEMLRAERGKILAAAVAAYRAGEIWTLTTEESAQSAMLNSEFERQDPWVEVFQEKLGMRSQISISQVFSEILNVEDINRRDRRTEMRIAAVLRSMGWVRRQIRIAGGQRCWVYQKPQDWQPTPEQQQQPVIEQQQPTPEQQQPADDETERSKQSWITYISTSPAPYSALQELHAKNPNNTTFCTDVYASLPPQTIVAIAQGEKLAQQQQATAHNILAIAAH